MQRAQRAGNVAVARRPRRTLTPVQEEKKDLRRLEKMVLNLQRRTETEKNPKILERVKKRLAKIQAERDEALENLEELEAEEAEEIEKAEQEQAKQDDTPELRGEPIERPKRNLPPAPPVRTGTRPEPSDPSEFVEPIVIPKLEKPTDMMYTIRQGRVHRASDGAILEPSNMMNPGTQALRDAYEQGREGLITVGIAGRAPGEWHIGGASSMWNPNNVADIKGEIPVEMALVGLTDDAGIVGLQLTENQTECHQVQLWNLGIVGGNSSYISQVIGEQGLVLLDGCWWVAGDSMKASGNMHISGMSVGAECDGFIVRNMVIKDGLMTKEHDFYTKGGGDGGRGSYGLGGLVALIDNELGVGNRTAIQIRPHRRSKYKDPHITPPQDGPVLFRGNRVKDLGMRHSYDDGGSVYTVWTSRSRTIIEDNVASSKYSCLAITQGGSETNPYLTKDGYSHAKTLIRNNHFESPDSKRACVMISGADETIFAGQNTIDGSSYGDVVLDSAFAARGGAKKNRKVRLIGPDSLAADSDVLTYDANVAGTMRRLTREEIEAMRESV